MKPSKFNSIYESVKKDTKTPTPIMEAILTEATDEQYLKYVLNLGEHLENKINDLLPKYTAKLDKNNVPHSFRDKFYTHFKNAIKEILPEVQTVFEDIENETYQFEDTLKADLEKYIEDGVEFYGDVEVGDIKSETVGTDKHPGDTGRDAKRILAFTLTAEDDDVEAIANNIKHYLETLLENMSVTCVKVEGQEVVNFRIEPLVIGESEVLEEDEETFEEKAAQDKTRRY